MKPDINKQYLEFVVEYNKTDKLCVERKFKKAYPILKKLLKEFEFKEGLTNLGLCYRAFEYYENELISYVRAISDEVPFLSEKPDVELILNIYNNIGQHYYEANEFEAAIAAYHRVLSNNPNRYTTWTNLAMLQLKKCSSGDADDWMDAWANYDSRILTKLAPPVSNDNEDLVQWDLKTFDKTKSIIILKEQGIGDHVMWGRYIEPLKKEFKEVYMQGHPYMYPLFPGTDVRMSTKEIDLGVNVCSLAQAFNNGAPIAGDWLRDKFEPRKFPESDKLNVGISWMGNPTHQNDHNRSTELVRFNRFAELVNLYPLMLDNDLKLSGNKYVKKLGLKSWDDTCSAIAGLDLVISVDTSVVHVAASMGCEVWLLQPKHATDFRWGTKEKCVWYDTVRIFENPGDWNVVFNNVYKALEERVCQTSVSLPA